MLKKQLNSYMTEDELSELSGFRTGTPFQAPRRLKLVALVPILQASNRGLPVTHRGIA